MKKCIRIVCIILLCILFAGCDAVGEIWVRYNENIRAYPTSGTYTNEQLALSFSFTSGENTVKYPDGTVERINVLRSCEFVNDDFSFKVRYQWDQWEDILYLKITSYSGDYEQGRKYAFRVET